MFAITMGFAALAQTKNVNKANSAFTKGELAEARDLIEPATKDPKSSVNGRTWYVRGQIYGAIYSSSDEAISSLDPDALNKALESYNKVFELEKERITLYPNPSSSGKFLLKTAKKTKIIKIVDLQGKSVDFQVTEDINSITIDISNTPKGLYIMTVSAGDRVYTKKIMH